MRLPPLRIGIEAQRLFRLRKHGMDIVALELIKQLQTLDQYNEYVIFVKPDLDRNVLPAAPNFRVVEVAGGPYPSWEQWALPRAARAAGVQLLHCTSNTAPLRPGVPLVLTLHDVIFLEQLQLRQGSWYQRAGNLYRRWNVPRVAPRCQRILTVSAWERERIRAALPLAAGRVEVVYNGVGPQFRPELDAARLAAARQRLGLPERFMLFLANTDPKKNLRGVLRALALLKSRGPLPCQLLLLDYPETALRQVLAELGLPELRADLLLLGYVPHAELPLLYNLAEVFLYPSLRESFGLPMLEAMACGTPVIAGSTSAMPEVAGEAALLVDPTQPAALADALHTLLHSPARRTLLREQGQQRARLFSWERTARQMLGVYEQVLRPVAARQSAALSPVIDC